MEILQMINEKFKNKEDSISLNTKTWNKERYNEFIKYLLR